MGGREGATDQVLTTLDDWHIHVVGGWTDIFELLAGEDIDGDHVNLSVTVLSSLRGGHLNNLEKKNLKRLDRIISFKCALSDFFSMCSAFITVGINQIQPKLIEFIHRTGFSGSTSTHLARASFDHDVLVLAESRALFWERGSGSGVSGVEVLVVVMIVRHGGTLE